MEETQISAIVSKTTKNLLEKQVRATGVKKGYLVEQALLHHLKALQELPAEMISHPKLTVTKSSLDTIAQKIEKGKPTKALKDLMRNED